MDHSNAAQFQRPLHVQLLESPELDAASAQAITQIYARTHSLCESAFLEGCSDQRSEFHTTLHALLSTHSAHPHSWGAHNHLSRVAFEIRKALWERYLGYELGRLATLDVDPVPEDPESLTEYLTEINAYHEASHHPVFAYLCDAAPLADVKAFFFQESRLDAHFDDLIALAQIGLDGPVKDEYADNFADEMGHGDPDRVHANLFRNTSAYVLDHGHMEHAVQTEPFTEALACSNMQLGMALDRRHVWRLAGYLAALELNAPFRCQQLVSACERHGMKRNRLGYLTEHIDADVGHAAGFFEEIIKPLAASDRRAPLEISQGFLLRLQTSKDYCDAILDSFLKQ